MAHKSEDRIKETSTTTGTGAMTLAGAVTGFRTFASVMTSPSDTCFYGIIGGAGEWETGLGTYSAANTLTRTTVLRSSNANAAVSFSTGTKEVFITVPATENVQFLPDNAIVLPVASTLPVVPSSDIKLYNRYVAARNMPAFSNVGNRSTILQPFLGGSKIITFQAQSGTNGTGGNGAFGPAWTSNGTVTHPTPSSTAPAITNQMKRTRYANVVTTQNQQLGPRMNTAAEQQFWLGNAAGLGGFFFYTKFTIELWPAATVRLFAGLSATATGSVCISNTVLNDTCGLWHDTADPASGAGAFNFVTRNTATTTKQSITMANALAAGNSYEFMMYTPPGGGAIIWELYDIRYNVSYSNNTSTTLPTSTAFMQPQVQMSNGTANTTVTTTAIGISSIYVESDH